MRAIRAILPLAIFCLLLAGCASTAPGGLMENDPLEGVNRVMFNVTIKADEVVLRPTALVYRRVVPQTVRESFRNFLNNLHSPVVFANDVLQGEIDRAGTTALRAGINTIFGIGGLLDVAGRWGYLRHSEDFGQTLAVYGVGEGPYLFIPLLGPGNPRDLIGYIVDFAFDPLTYVQWGNEIWVPYTRFGLDYLDVRERNIETLDEIELNSLDYYASVRSLYRQTRANEIRNGATEIEDLPDF
jgi:phospholipid-binding lipoprotein MlaA